MRREERADPPEHKREQLRMARGRGRSWAMLAVPVLVLSVLTSAVNAGSPGDPDVLLDGLTLSESAAREISREYPYFRSSVVTDGGHLVAVVGDGPGDLQLVSVSPAGGTPAILDTISCNDAVVAALEPAGEFVVYNVVGTSCPSTLRSVHAGGGEPPTTITTEAGLPFGSVTPDGATVVFPGLTGGLLAAPVSGAAVVELAPEGVRVAWRLSPDQSTVVFVETEPGQQSDLYSVSLTGGPLRHLNASLGPQADVGEFEISPDGATVVFKAGRDDPTGQQVELYSVPTGGGAATRLNPDLVDRGDVRNFVISPDSQTVVYRADQDVDGVGELYSSPIDGGGSVKLNPPLVPGGDVHRATFFVSPDSSEVVYVADQDTNGVDELYLVSIGGGAVRKLSEATAGSASDGVTDVYPHLGWSPLVYSARRQLFSVDTEGGSPVSLSGDAVPSGSAFYYSAQRAGDRVVYQNTSGGVVELYSVPIAGGRIEKLNPPLPSGGDVDDFFVADDGVEVVYLADQDARNQVEAYAVPAAGGDVVSLNGDVVDGGDVSLPALRFQRTFSPSSPLVLAADTDNTGSIRWFAVDLPVRCDGRQATIVGTDGPDELIGTAGADVIQAFGGDDVIRAGRGRDVVCAGAGDDDVRAGRGKDRVFGGPGDDRISGGRGGDRVWAGAGTDVILGEAGRDELNGGRGGDAVRGGPGSDVLRGGRGPDSLWGGTGDDTLRGGRGADTCVGGPGSDTVRSC